jgi:hypothetical protein
MRKGGTWHARNRFEALHVSEIRDGEPLYLLVRHRTEARLRGDP